MVYRNLVYNDEEARKIKFYRAYSVINDSQVADVLIIKDKNSICIKHLAGTANCFSNPRYMNGAATNPDFDVVARAGGQIKCALDATISLDGENYVFQDGREG